MLSICPSREDAPGINSTSASFAACSWAELGRPTMGMPSSFAHAALALESSMSLADMRNASPCGFQ